MKIKKHSCNCRISSQATLCLFTMKSWYLADGKVLTKGKAFIDYSLITGESLPALKEWRAGISAAKSPVAHMEILAAEVAQAILTRLWNKEMKESDQPKSVSLVHLLSQLVHSILCWPQPSRPFTGINNPANAGRPLQLVFIIACPLRFVVIKHFYQWQHSSVYLAENRFSPAQPGYRR